MSERPSDIALLTPVPLQHLESGLAKCRQTGLVVYGTEATIVLSDFAKSVEDGSSADIFFYASEGRAVGPPVVTYRGRFEDYRGARAGRADKEWSRHRPDSTSSDGAWQSFYAVSDLRKLEEPIPISQFSKRNTATTLSRTFYPRGPIIIDAPVVNTNSTITVEEFGAALLEAESMTLEELRAASGAGKSRSYFVHAGSRSFPLKAVARLAYLRAHREWDRPQSSALARRFRNDFNIEHITERTERQRLERQRQTIELGTDRWLS